MSRRSWLLSLCVGSFPALMAHGCANARVEPEPNGRRVIRVQADNSGVGCVEGKDPSFSVDAIEALVANPTQTSIGLRSLLSLPLPDSFLESKVDLTVTTRLMGAPKIQQGCGRIDQEVELTLRFEQPALDVVIAGRLSAFAEDVASFVTELDPSVIEAMQLPGLERGLSAALLELKFWGHGVEGRVMLMGACGARLTIPGDVRCEVPSQIELGLDETVHGVRVGDTLESLVAWLSEMSPMPVRWEDGADTTLSIAVDQPSYACGFRSAMHDVSLPANLTAPLQLRLVTQDRRLDLELPARLSWGLNPRSLDEPGWDGAWTLRAAQLFSPAALREAHVFPHLDLPEERAVLVRVEASESRSLSRWWNIEVSALPYSPLAAGRPEGSVETPGPGNIYCFSGAPEALTTLLGPLEDTRTPHAASASGEVDPAVGAWRKAAR